MTQLKLAGEGGSLSDINASQAQFREQIAALTDLVRQVAGNAAVAPGSALPADPLSAPFTLYVNPYIGSDRFIGGSYNDYESNGSDEEIIASKLKRIENQRLECGYTPQRPFKTINRAVIEAAIITSKNWYTYTDPRAHLDCVSIVLAPGVHTLYNDPGSGSTNLSSWGEVKDPTVQELIAFNPASVGGVLLPRGCSLCGPDLRKTTIRPSWVPGVEDEAADYGNRRGMLKITGTGYFFGFTVMDKVGLNASHHLLDVFHFASKAELDSFYAKCFSAVGTGADLAAALTVTRSTEHEIVGPIDQAQLPTASWDTTASASPYIFNCSVRSDYGLGGAFIDGAKVGGLKSMVCANFTGVSLQRDMSCWQRYSGGNWVATTYQQYIESDPNSIRMHPARLSRHISAIREAFIQEVSVFAIGHGVHHFTDLGGEITITNSNSSFGGCAALSKGYKGFAFGLDRNWSVARIRVPLRPDQKAGNVRKIYLGELQALTASQLTLTEPLAVDPQVPTVPALLAKDGYSLPAGTKIWVENPVGPDWSSDLGVTPWVPEQASRITIAAALSEAGTGEAVGINPETGTSLALGKRVYIRRVVDTRTPSERRVTLLLNNTAEARIPERNYVLQTDPLRTGGAIGRRLLSTGPEVLTVLATGTGPAAGSGVTKTAEISLRRGAPDETYSAGRFYRAGTVVKHLGKHYQALRDLMAQGTAPDLAQWGETFVHMPSSYDAEDSLKGEAAILSFDTDTDPNEQTSTCGINFNAIWTSSGTVRDQYRSSTDYLGVHAFLMALGLSSSAAHEVLIPRVKGARDLDPADANDLPQAPAAGAALGRGNWAVEFRRPSVLRLYGHAWEWAGFLNYSKAIPGAQKDLSPQNRFTYYFTNEAGGRVVPQGSNEEGFGITPRGLEDIETGATLSVENLGSINLDEFQRTDFPNGLTASQITVDNLTVNGTIAIPGLDLTPGGLATNDLTVNNLTVTGGTSFAEGSRATTSRLGSVRLATVDAIVEQNNPAQSNGDINAAANQVINLASLDRWRVERNLLGGAQAEATLVILHVAQGTPLTGEASVPAGYPTSGHTFLGESGIEGEANWRRRSFKTVTEAVRVASQIYVPVGSEIVISVHDSLTGVEAGPLMLGNSVAPWVVAGARGATAPKIRLRRGTTQNPTNRLPQYSLSGVYSAGAIFADLEVEVDINGSGDSQYLSLNGGFGVCQRDLVINWINAGDGASVANGTCTYGGTLQVRVYMPLNNGDRKIRTALSGEGAPSAMYFYAQAGGLLGHGATLTFDFRVASYNTENGTLIWEFDHSYPEASVPFIPLALGARSGCKIGGRVGPQVKWNFSGKSWNFSSYGGSFAAHQNLSGLSFRTQQLPEGDTLAQTYGISDATAETITPITFRRGATLHINGEGSQQAGMFGLHLALEGKSYGGGTLPSPLVVARNYEGSYVYGGNEARNLSTP